MAGSSKGKVEIEIIIAVSRSIQVSCLVLPFMVLLGWIIGTDMSLVFNRFETMILFVTILYFRYLVFTYRSLVCGLILDGRSNYFKGIMGVSLYLVWFLMIKKLTSDYQPSYMVLSINLRTLSVEVPA